MIPRQTSCTDQKFKQIILFKTWLAKRVEEVAEKISFYLHPRRICHSNVFQKHFKYSIINLQELKYMCTISRKDAHLLWNKGIS
jgi:hypothetical protein